MYDHQPIKKFLSENTRFTTALRIPGILLIIAGAFIMTFVWHGIPIGTPILIAGIVWCLVAGLFRAKKKAVLEGVSSLLDKEREDVLQDVRARFESGAKLTEYAFAQCLVGDGIKLRKVKDKAFVSSKAAVNALAVDMRKKYIAGRAVEFDFLSESRSDVSFGMYIENISEVKTAKLPYSKDGVTCDLVAVEITSEGQTFRTVWNDDYEAEQLIAFLGK